MVLDNFTAAISSFALNQQKTFTKWNISNDTSSQNTQIWSSADTLRTSRAINSYRLSADTGVAIVCGTGDTAPTASDYKLENMIDMSGVLSYLSGEIVASTNPKTLYSVTQTYQNISSSPVTVSEIGILAGLGYDWQNSVFTLLTRDVLSTPVVIPANATYSFNVSINANT